MKKDYKELKDAELIGLSAKGDEHAFKALVDRHGRWAYGFVMRNVHNPDTAWDITQDAFVRVFKNLDSFRQESSFGTWFRRILYNLCIDYWRKNKKHNALEYMDELSVKSEAGKYAVQKPDATPEQNSTRKEAVILLEEAVATLSVEHKTVITLREIEGKSYEEIAEIMNCPKGTVMSRLYHARKKIVEYMSRNGYTTPEL